MRGLDPRHELGVRVGSIVRVEANAAARQPAYRLWIDSGNKSVLQSSAKITDLYSPADLVGRRVVAVTGLDPLRVAGFRSDALVLGCSTQDGVALICPDRRVADGTPVA